MGWTAPRDWTVGEVVTEAMMDTHVKDNFSYLKGIGQVPTIQSGLIIDNTLGTEYFKIPSLTTTQRDAISSPAAGMLIYNSTTTKFNKYENAAWREDLAYNGDISLLQIASQAEGDILYRGASAWARLGKGTAGQYLHQNAGLTAPEWVTSNSKDIFLPVIMGSGGFGMVGDFGTYQLNPATEYAAFILRVPGDFVSLTSVKIVVAPNLTGTFDWTVASDWGAAGEVYNANTDSATADGQAATTDTFLELDISAAFTGIAANDVVGFTFTVDAFVTMSTLYVYGVNVLYNST